MSRIFELCNRLVLLPLKSQLTLGITPRDLALSCALGLTLGIFPILGSTTFLCFVAGLIWRLNQPAIQTVNYLVYPVQIALVPVFVRMGEMLFQVPPVPLMPQEFVHEFMQGPGQFLSKYGKAGLYAIIAWMMSAPVLIVFFYYSLRSIFVRIKQALPERTTDA